MSLLCVFLLSCVHPEIACVIHKKAQSHSRFPDTSLPTCSQQPQDPVAQRLLFHHPGSKFKQSWAVLVVMSMIKTKHMGHKKSQRKLYSQPNLVTPLICTFPLWKQLFYLLFRAEPLLDATCKPGEVLCMRAKATQSPAGAFLTCSPCPPCEVQDRVLPSALFISRSFSLPQLSSELWVQVGEKLQSLMTVFSWASHSVTYCNQLQHKVATKSWLLLKQCLWLSVYETCISSTSL